jgi:hypothetical protein
LRSGGSDEYKNKSGSAHRSVRLQPRDRSIDRSARQLAQAMRAKCCNNAHLAPGYHLMKRSGRTRREDWRQRPSSRGRRPPFWRVAVPSALARDRARSAGDSAGGGGFQGARTRAAACRANVAERKERILIGSRRFSKSPNQQELECTTEPRIILYVSMSAGVSKYFYLILLCLIFYFILEIFYFILKYCYLLIRRLVAQSHML